jgi:hypothetical protein
MKNTVQEKQRYKPKDKLPTLVQSRHKSVHFLYLFSILLGFAGGVGEQFQFMLWLCEDVTNAKYP